MNTVWTKYRVELGTTGRLHGSYLGDTVEQLHTAIDSDLRLDDGLRRILKYGYFGEFENGEYITKDYVIDNCMHLMWTVRERTPVTWKYYKVKKPSFTDKLKRTISIWK